MLKLRSAHTMALCALLHPAELCLSLLDTVMYRVVFRQFSWVWCVSVSGRTHFVIMDNCLQKVQVSIVCIYVFICFSTLPWAEMVEKYLLYNSEGKWSQERGLHRSTQYMRAPIVPPALTVPGRTPGAPPHCPPHVTPCSRDATAAPNCSFLQLCPSCPHPQGSDPAGAPLLPLCQPSGYPGGSNSAPLPEAVGHDARKNYWVKNWECQTQAVKKNEDINKKLSIWLLGLYYISFHLHRITPSPCETGRDWVSVTQGSSHLSNCQSILSCNTPTCNFADEMIFFCCQPPPTLLKFSFMVWLSL